jgi:hypothetical protein
MKNKSAKRISFLSLTFGWQGKWLKSSLIMVVFLLVVSFVGDAPYIREKKELAEEPS